MNRMRLASRNFGDSHAGQSRANIAFHSAVNRVAFNLHLNFYFTHNQKQQDSDTFSRFQNSKSCVQSRLRFWCHLVVNDRFKLVNRPRDGADWSQHFPDSPLGEIMTFRPAFRSATKSARSFILFSFCLFGAVTITSVTDLFFITVRSGLSLKEN